MQYTYNGWSGVNRMENNEPPLMQCYSNPKKAKLTAEVRHRRPAPPRRQGPRPAAPYTWSRFLPVYFYGALKRRIKLSSAMAPFGD